MREFALGELFDILTTKQKFNASHVKFLDEGGHPYVSRGSTNNGIRGYIEEDTQFLNDANTFSFGQDTSTVFWQKNPYFTGDKIKVLKPKFSCNEKLAQFLVVQISKAFSNFSWGTQSFDVKVLNKQPVLLPIQTTPDNTPIIDTSNTYHPEGFIPDWDFMAKYIKAIEKEVIRGVVEYKDEMIAKTKQVVANSEKATA
jgi:hypothetical protein